MAAMLRTAAGAAKLLFPTSARRPITRAFSSPCSSGAARGWRQYELMFDSGAVNVQLALPSPAPKPEDTKIWALREALVIGDKAAVDRMKSTGDLEPPKTDAPPAVVVKLPQHLKLNFEGLSAEMKAGELLISVPQFKENSRAFRACRSFTENEINIEIEVASTTHDIEGMQGERSAFYRVHPSADPSRNLQKYCYREKEDSVLVVLGMPGVAKENVRVFARDKVVFVEGEEVVPGVLEPQRKFGGVVLLPVDAKYNLAGAKAVMMSGTLHLMVPKIVRPSMKPRVYEMDK